MRPRPLPDPDDEPRREPLEHGRLDPPRRKPPTAVGTATPRGPRRPYRRGRYDNLGLTRTRRIAMGLLSGMLATSGGVATVVAWPGAGSWWGLGVVAMGVALAYQVIAARTPYDGLAEYLRRRRRNAGRRNVQSKPPST
jgi:hypothetical protein